MGNHSSNNSSHLNASSADAPSAHASAVHSAAAPSSAAPSKQSSGAAASASGKGSAGIAQQVTAASASSSLSGRKRSAAAESVGPSAAAAAAASAAPSSEQSTESASNASQSKKQRREASSKERNGPSAAAAAVASSVGIDPLPAPRRPAASSAAASSGIDQLSSGSDESSDDERSDSCDDERSDESDDGSDEEQEWRPAAHAAAASAAESASSRRDLQSQPEESEEERRINYWKQQLQLGNGVVFWVPVGLVHVFDAQRLCTEAQRLIRGVLPFAEAEVNRFDPVTAAQVRGKMQELQAAQTELQSMDALPLADQADQRAVQQAQIEELTVWIKSHGGTCAILRAIDTARAVTERQLAGVDSMESLGQLCFYLVQFGRFCPPLPAEQQEVFRSWLLRVDSLFTRLCESAPYAALTQWQAQVLLIAALHSGAFQLVTVLMRGTGCDLSWSIDLDPFLAMRYFNSQSHVVCYQPYLRLFEFGLDPTQIKDGGNPLSALQLARNFVRDHPPPAVSAPNPMASVQSALDETGDVEHGAIPSVLAAYAIHHQQPMGPVETARRAALHARFMHATIPAWRSHSDKVRSLLLAAAPGRLIPPLVDVVSRYLDLEGVPPERSVPVDDAAEMD